jgi:serine/threonine-protein kinase
METERIGRYEILAELGRGAMGAVYRARDPQIGRTVAIKRILTAHLPPDELPQYKQRFYREAQAAGQMSHPGIVTIHDIAEDEAGQPYLVMEFIEGTPLDKLLTPGAERLTLEQSLDIGIQMAEALDYAHRRGVVHRDVKPANILITAEGRAKIADFGIAKLAGMQLTTAGQMLGTPAFMSPEQFSGAALDGRSDLFSLGAMLYWMFTGEKPFAGDTLTAVSFKVVYTAPIPATQLNPSLPAALDAVLARCLAKNPGERYAAGRDLAADLRAVKEGRPVTAAPPVPETEKTTLHAVPVVATPWPAAPAPAAERTQAVPAAGAGVAATWPERKKIIVFAGALALLLLVAGVAWWLWPEEAPPAGGTRATVSAPAPPRETSGPPPWSKASPKARQQQERPAALSTLRVECLHNFRSANLEIYADGRQVLSTVLRGESQDLGVMKVYQGTLRTSAQVPAGTRTIRVRVRSSADRYEEEDQILGTFAEGGVRVLGIEFGRGSGFGVVERKLTLRWK